MNNNAEQQQESKQQRLQDKLLPEIQQFREQRQTIQLATIDKDGRPNVSYAPFVVNQHGYFVLISEMARHARNLALNSQVSLMLIEDEQQAKQIFARKRLTFDAQATKIERDSPLWLDVIEQLESRFGDIINGLSQLADFDLFCLAPSDGLYVKGFGQAFQVSANDLINIVHIDKGHRKIAS